MARRSLKVRVRPGWDRQTQFGLVDGQIVRRRWRILQSAGPEAASFAPMPPWVHTPDQFVEWLFLRLAAGEMRQYFPDLALIARRSCDLELLRFARHHLARQ